MSRMSPEAAPTHRDQKKHARKGGDFTRVRWVAGRHAAGAHGGVHVGLRHDERCGPTHSRVRGVGGAGIGAARGARASGRMRARARRTPFRCSRMRVACARARRVPRRAPRAACAPAADAVRCALCGACHALTMPAVKYARKNVSGVALRRLAAGYAVGASATPSAPQATACRSRTPSAARRRQAVSLSARQPVWLARAPARRRRRRRRRRSRCPASTPPSIVAELSIADV
jgi:hypothetical protein